MYNSSTTSGLDGYAVSGDLFDILCSTLELRVNWLWLCRFEWLCLDQKYLDGKVLQKTNLFEVQIEKLLQLILQFIVNFSKLSMRYLAPA